VRCILSDESTALVPIEEKQVNFYGDEIVAALAVCRREGKSPFFLPLGPRGWHTKPSAPHMVAEMGLTINTLPHTFVLSDKLLVEINGQRQIYVPIRPLCNYLGLDWSAQLQRMKRDEVLAESMTSVVITPTLVSERQCYNQRYTLVCLELEMLPGWLFGISTSRVRPDLQDKIKRYRRECYRVLWQAFQADVLSLVGPVLRKLLRAAK